MKNYPNQTDSIKAVLRDLKKLSPDMMKAYSELHKSVLKPGVLSSKTKELIALGISIQIRCDACIGFHVKDALKAGATQEEIIETIDVAVLMGGGPSLMYATEALVALRQYSAIKIQN